MYELPAESLVIQTGSQVKWRNCLGTEGRDRDRNE